MVSKAKRSDSGVSSIVFTILALVVIGTAVFWYVRYSSTHQPQRLELTPEAKQYVRNLKLSDVEIKAHESYMKQMVVDIVGKIGNSGDRPLQTVEIFCSFHDPYGQLVLRQRVPIVSARMGGLKPGETKSFRLPFDEIPESLESPITEPGDRGDPVPMRTAALLAALAAGAFAQTFPFMWTGRAKRSPIS